MKSKIITVSFALIAVALLVISPVAADESAPSLPTSVYGTVTYSNGDPVTVGTILIANVSGITSQYVVKEANKIGESGVFGEKFLVSGNNQGADIIFTINNIASEQKGIFDSGTAAEVNLVFGIQKEEIGISPSAGASANFKDNPTIIAKEGVIIPDTLKVNVDVIPDIGSLPQTPVNTTNVKTFDISVENAEGLGGEFAVEIPISVSDSELKTSFKNNKNAVVVYHDKSTEWEDVPIKRTEEKSGYTNFYIVATAFSPYMLGVDTQSPTNPSSDSSSSSSSKQTGGSYVIQDEEVSPTAIPTVSVTQIPGITSTTKPTTQPTQQSPAPFLGIIAGFGAVALVLTRMRH